jgi:hypothetical protein
VVKLPAWIALMNVDLTGENAATCKYCVASCTFEISYTLLLISFCRFMYWCVIVIIRVLSNGTIHNHVLLSRCPCITMLPFIFISPSITLALPSSNHNLYPASHTCPHNRGECCTSPLIIWADLDRRLRYAVANDFSAAPFGSLTFIGMCAILTFVHSAPRLR